MSATATADAEKSAPVRCGFPGLTCPLCAQKDDAVIALQLDDCETFHCFGCDADFAVDDVREMIASWQKVLAWIDPAPAVE